MSHWSKQLVEWPKERPTAVGFEFDRMNQIMFILDWEGRKILGFPARAVGNMLNDIHGKDSNDPQNRTLA